MHRQTISFSSIALMLVSSAIAAPDPNLFDGRVPPPPSQNSERSGAEGSTGQEPAAETQGGGEQSSAGSNERDFDAIGTIGGGQRVDGVESKTAPGEAGTEGDEPPTPPETDTGGGGAGQPTDSQGDGNGVGGSGTGGALTEGTGGGSGGDPSSETRSFDDFGFGGAGPDKTVEVNRSKSTGQTGTERCA